MDANDPLNGHPSPPASNGARLRDGRFGKGNQFGKGGNPYLRRIHQLRQKLLDCTTEQDIEQIIATLRKQSAEGDVASIKLWLEYALGRPSQSIELSGLDGEPLGLTITQLKAVILEAVGDAPEAQVRLARALRALTRNAEVSTDDDLSATG
jgi:hypothetical protein